VLRVVTRRTKVTSVPSGSSVLPGTRIDGILVTGAAIFGVGWGLAGYCPGPAIVSIGFGRVAPVLFFAASVAGMLLADAVRARSPKPVPPADDEVPCQVPALRAG
jgi:uncharacterized membrane protein YedE/YeeE